LREVADYVDALRKGVDLLLDLKAGRGVVIHHDDADGICSGAIALEALRRKKMSADSICLEKLFPQVVESLYSQGKYCFFIFADLAASHAHWISDLANDTLTIILDHHQAQNPTNPSVLSYAPDLYGFKGYEDASGSIITYLFMKILESSITDLSSVALVGAYEIPGEIRMFNRIVLEEAMAKGLAKPKGRDYSLLIGSSWLSRRRFSTMLNILGSVGYYRGGVELGIEACLKGPSSKIGEAVERWEAERKLAFRRLLTRLSREGLNQMRYVQWFQTEEFHGMGSKTIGNFCSYLRFQRFIDPDKYLLGIMPLLKVIPGYGELKESYVKISVRAPKPLEKKIKRGEMPPITSFLIELSSALGGFADGHPVAASAVIPRDKINIFLERIDLHIQKNL